MHRVSLPAPAPGDQTAVPPELRELVTRSASDRALDACERAQVVRELTAHIQDALGAGMTADAVRAEFGDPDLTRALIARAKVRGRPMRRRQRLLRLASLAALILTSSAYGASAVRLHIGVPARAVRADDIASMLALSTLERSARAHVTRARSMWQRQDVDGAMGAAIEGLASAERMAATGEPLHALVAAEIAGELIVLADTLAAARRRDARLERLARQVARLRPATRVDLNAARALIDSLVARMYTGGGDGNGRLTSSGLRLAQAAKGVREPSLGARAAEPVYFAFPPSRAIVRHEVMRTLLLAERARARGPGSEPWEEFEAAVRRFGDAGHGTYRYAPLAIVAPRLARALRAEAMVSAPK